MNQTPQDDFSEQYLEMAFRTTFRKRPAVFDAYGCKSRECGDALEVFLAVKNGVISQVYHYANGCFAANACGNALVELAAGKTPQEAQSITPQNVADFLETLPAHEFHCAEMAVAALKLALRDLAEKTQPGP